MPTTPNFQSGYPFSFRQYTANGSTSNFSLPFPYLAQGHIKVYVDGTLQLSGVSFPTTDSILFATPPAAGAVVLVRRETPVNPLVTYVNAASFKASNLNVTARQNLYLAQEIADVTIGEAILNADLIDARDRAEAAAAAAAISRDDASDFKDLAEAASAAAILARDEAAAIVEALTTTYDIGASVPFLPAPGERFLTHAVIRAVILKSGGLGCAISTDVAGTQDLEVVLYKGTTQVATATLLANATLGSVTIPADVPFSIGDTLVGKVVSANPSAPQQFGLTLKFELDLL